MSELCLRNRQRTRRLNLPLFRRIARALLDQELKTKQFELGVTLVAAPEMSVLNETFLQHAGSTDVLAFHYRDADQSHTLHGEIFISVDDAVKQARRFRTTWQSEVFRYLVHGCLHLHGYDDRGPATRRNMKREENRLLKKLAQDFRLQELAANPAEKP